VKKAASARRVVVLIFPEFQSLDLSGPIEILTRASLVAQELGRGVGYALTLASKHKGLVRASAGIDVLATRALAPERGVLDTLLVVGGPGVSDAAQDPAYVQFVKRTARRARRVGSVCTGAFLLGAAGLLDGRRATTHWAHAQELARYFPNAEVDADAIYTSDGPIHTSAGITAGMDLALAWVEADLGRDVALHVARHLVMYVQRSGGQSQFSPQLRTQTASYEPLRRVQAFVLDNVTHDLSVAVLARMAGMSARNFARLFHREAGVTPAVFVEQARVDVARRLLEQTTLGLDHVAVQAGFGRVETLRRAFARTLSLNASEYRKRFRARRR
jgi:transcriptional regulator GlxA family with amidase domain